jgi:DNA-binding transcriptional regulator YhcF (GntR family)
MAQNKALTPAQVKILTAYWQQPKGDRPSQEAMALEFGVAPVTIRRALAEEGFLELAGYKTVKDTAILEFLESQGLNNIERLRQFVSKARTGHRGK